MVTPGVEILAAVTPDHLAQVRALFRTYQSQLPSHLRFPDSEWQDLPGAYGPPGGELLLATVAGQPPAASACVRFPFPLPAR